MSMSFKETLTSSGPGTDLAEEYGDFDMHSTGGTTSNQAWVCRTCGNTASVNELSLGICNHCNPIEQTRESYTGKVFLITPKD